MEKTSRNPTTPLTSTGSFFVFLLGLLVFVALAIFAVGCVKAPEHASAMPTLPTLPTLDLPAIQRVECGGQLTKTLLSVPHNVANGIKHAAMVGRPFTAVEAATVIMIADEWARTRQCLGLGVPE